MSCILVSTNTVKQFTPSSDADRTSYAHPGSRQALSLCGPSSSGVVLCMSSTETVERTSRYSYLRYNGTLDTGYCFLPGGNLDKNRPNLRSPMNHLSTPVGTYRCARESTDALPENRGNWDPVKVLVAHEKEKDKYLEDWLVRRCHFTPLVLSVDALWIVEATAVGNLLGAMLSAKWNRSYPDVCGYVRSRVSIAR